MNKCASAKRKYLEESSIFVAKVTVGSEGAVSRYDRVEQLKIWSNQGFDHLLSEL